MPYYTVTDETEFTLLIDCLFHTEFKYVYISVGGKYNENVVELNNLGKKKIIKTNSESQLCPSFLLEREVPILIICFDVFQNKASADKNREIIESRINPNIQFIFYDMQFTISSICEKISYMKTKFYLHNIPEKSIMICNFVRFLNNPSFSEQPFDFDLSDAIYNTLVHTPYNITFYEWFGYSLPFYNLIYNYNNYRISYYMVDYHHIAKIKDNIDSPIGMYSIDEINKISSRFHLPSKVINHFLKNVVDLYSSKLSDNESIADTLYCVKNQSRIYF